MKIPVPLLLASTLFPLVALGNPKPLQVFILAGQSNMQGHAQVRTFEHIGMDPRTAPMLKEMLNNEGTPRVCEQVWISSIGSSDQEKTGKLTAGFGAQARGPKIGPEFTFGLYMQKSLDQPILIIKTAWGGRSLHTDFRPPGAGPYRFNEQELAGIKKQGKDLQAIQAAKAEMTGRSYRLMMEHVKYVLSDLERVCPAYDADAGYELAGFVWFQGWNDMVGGGVYPDRGKPGGYRQYSELLAQLIRDVRKDLSAPDLPFVIGVLGVGGAVEKYGPDQQRYKGVHQNFRSAMAAPAELPEFKGRVVAVLTETCWDAELTRLTTADAALRKQVKQRVSEAKIDRSEEAAMLEKLRAETFSADERAALEKGISNQAYHYLGSAKIIGQIGKAFAEALIEIQEE